MEFLAALASSVVIGVCLVALIVLSVHWVYIVGLGVVLGLSLALTGYLHGEYRCTKQLFESTHYHSPWRYFNGTRPSCQRVNVELRSGQRLWNIECEQVPWTEVVEYMVKK